jgi:hypothetical protein
VYDTEINAARNILARATDPQIGRFTSTQEVKRILVDRAGTVENCATTTQATTIGGGCERKNLPPNEQQRVRSK